MPAATIDQAMAEDLESIRLIFDWVDGTPAQAQAPHCPEPALFDAEGIDDLARSIEEMVGLDEELDFDSEEEPGQQD